MRDTSRHSLEGAFLPWVGSTDLHFNLFRASLFALRQVDPQHAILELGVHLAVFRVLGRVMIVAVTPLITAS